MKLTRTPIRSKQESTIALINIVFLMLIFFLVAGSLAPPLEKDIQLIETETAKPTPPPKALALKTDGSLVFAGSAISLEGFLQQRPDKGAAVQLVVDREVPASKLLEVVADLRAGGSEKVRVITQRGVK